MDLVSVIMPVYNVEKYIEDSVNSILNQTYHNIEIVIVDDYSSDNTYDILQKMALKDSRIKLYRNSKNMKIVETLNFAFKHSRGEFICRMDGDDISHDQRIEKKLSYLLDNPDLSLVGCSVLSISEDGKVMKKKRMPSDQKTITKTLKYAIPVFHIWLARREVYEELNGYRNIPYVEDYDFLLRMTTIGLKYSNITDYFGYYIRQHSSNTISNVGIIQRKAHRYCFELFTRRIRRSEDDFSSADFDNYVNSSTCEKKMFQYSNLLLQKALAITNRLSICKYFYFLVSYLMSNEQRRYINDRFRTQVYFRLNGGK